MISNIKIENFKSLKSVEVPELKGLNVFWGKNNSGKSAIMQAILLLKQSLESNEIVYNGALINLGDFEIVSFGSNVDNIIKINIKFKLDDNNNSILSDSISQCFKPDASILKDIRFESINYGIKFGKKKFNRNNI